MKITTDPNLCIGCGLCSSTCEEVFELKDGKSNVIKPEGCDCDCDLKEVAQSCPVGAIIVEE
ncbi:ferredoxin [bacterium CG2_30_37_16]|nr:MAG: ferredoxin [bacterium CG2_30_37_16]PIP30839.1 MAG: ferredoxin [bacterium (Candidatus Howlettbacteria) CG23_combo_of_CG06-09_8_20_14_all_37_9]PIY00518.1 MAG: ferredoxin [bacterium (Candidatus Howlettbacteria) CG_4_10_14_3_um_filter_37_10]PJB06115.1 MAG: ferredoxin [bacterium (Candidatus Howlettbacteria) CG_4_9_14_3_um_filter_37_10]